MMSITEYLELEAVKLSAISVGEVLVADNGFDCIESWSSASVEKDNRGELFIACKCGQHFLEGQLDLDDNDTLVGLRRERATETGDRNTASMHTEEAA
jgi:hypothetical protein